MQNKGIRWLPKKKIEQEELIKCLQSFSLEDQEQENSTDRIVGVCDTAVIPNEHLLELLFLSIWFDTLQVEEMCLWYSMFMLE